jgi:hypothetical protein
MSQEKEDWQEIVININDEKKALLHHYQSKHPYYIKIQSTGNCENYFLP